MTRTRQPRLCKIGRGWNLGDLLLAWIGLRLLAIRAFREQDAAFLARLKAFNHRWLNPWMLHRAGHGWWYAARLEHHGRKTNRLYATPICADPVVGGFLVPVPYGQDVDWARNLLHAGAGVLQDHDVRYRIGNPRVVSAAAAPDLPWLTREIIHLYGIRELMRVDILPSLTAAVPPPAGIVLASAAQNLRYFR